MDGNGQGSQAAIRNMVVFRLGRQMYALPIEPIVQIIEMVTVMPIPQTNHSMEGMINFHGSPVPVVNVRRHLGLPENPFELHTPIILAQVSDKARAKSQARMVGLIVDEVMDVLDLPADRVARPADILPEGLGDTPLLQGVIQTRQGMLLLLDLERFFQPNQAGALAQFESLPVEMVEAMPDMEPVVQ